MKDRPGRYRLSILPSRPQAGKISIVGVFANDAEARDYVKALTQPWAKWTWKRIADATKADLLPKLPVE